MSASPAKKRQPAGSPAAGGSPVPAPNREEVLTDLEGTRPSVLDRARRGDADDFGEIYRCFAYGCARRLGLHHHDAEDLAQQTMLELLKLIPTFQYDPERRFRSLVETIVRRRAVDDRRKLRPTLTGEVALDPPDSAESLEAVFDREWAKAHLLAALDLLRARLKPSTFQSFQLYCLEGWSVERVTKTLGLTRDQVYQNKRRVTELIRQYFKDLSGKEA